MHSGMYVNYKLIELLIEILLLTWLEAICLKRMAGVPPLGGRQSLPLIQ